MTRRSFLKTAVVAGAAPLALHSSLFAAAAARATRSRWGFIGIGAQGFGLLNNSVPRNKFRVLAVCDVDTTRRNLGKQTVDARYSRGMVSADYKGCDTYEDFREMLARRDIDAVVIATPDRGMRARPLRRPTRQRIFIARSRWRARCSGRAMVNATRTNRRVFQTRCHAAFSGEFRSFLPD